MDRVCYSLQCKTKHTLACHDIKQNFTREEIWRNIVWFSSHVKENYSKFILRQYILSFIQSLCFMVGNNMTIEINSSLSVQGEEKLALNFILNFQCDRWLKLTISGHYIVERRQTGEKSVPGTMMEPFCSESLQGINSSVHVSLHPSLPPPPNPPLPLSC